MLQDRGGNLYETTIVEKIRISDDEWVVFTKMLNNPPSPTAALQRLMAEGDRLVLDRGT